MVKLRLFYNSFNNFRIEYYFVDIKSYYLFWILEPLRRSSRLLLNKKKSILFQDSHGPTARVYVVECELSTSSGAEWITESCRLSNWNIIPFIDLPYLQCLQSKTLCKDAFWELSFSLSRNSWWWYWVAGCRFDLCILKYILLVK